ncbi:MAG: hypothetical protein AAGC46_12165 [Solirubrobacteraceae bacterium]|nr:hypothetical protein [Patulibacter sp.]
MHAHCDHDEVRDAEDRSWTFVLLDVVADPSTDDDERDEAFETLAHLEDHRAIGPLSAMLQDVTLPVAWRNGASDALRSTDDTGTSEQRCRWWATGDPPLMRHALLSMWPTEADILLGVVADPTHPLLAYALATTAHGFDQAGFVRPAIDALHHPDPEVREIAADVLLWNEPVAAELPLLGALDDPERDVVLEVLSALHYYPTRRVIRALADLRGTDDPEIAEAADTAFEDVRGTFEWIAAAAVRDDADGGAALRAWMTPIADLVTWPEPEEPVTPRLSIEVEPGVVVAEAEVRALLDDADGRWVDVRRQLHAIDWAPFDEDARHRLADAFLGHPDPDVRSIGTTPLATWERTRDLETLLGDPSRSVRKAAGYTLASVSASPAVADALWTRVMESFGHTAREALASYVHHAHPEVAVLRLEALAQEDPRDDLRVGAIDALAELRASAAIERLVPLLEAPPGTTWGVHLALLRAVDSLGLPTPDLSLLEFVDDVHLMAAVLGLQARP